MRTLTLYQQSAIAKLAREYAKENCSKADERAKVYAVKTAIAQSAPKSAGARSSNTATTKSRLSKIGKNPPKKHNKAKWIKARHVKKRAFSKGDDREGEQTVQPDNVGPLFFCRLCEQRVEPSKLTEHRLKCLASKTAEDSASRPSTTTMRRGSRTSGYYDDGTGVHIYQGGLCGGK